MIFLFKLQEGQFYSVKWGSVYYRGEILAITASKSHPTTNDYVVRLVDYGTIDIFTRSSIFRLPRQELFDIPPQAIRCCLKNWHLSNSEILDRKDLKCIDGKFRERLWNHNLSEHITVILHKNSKILSCPQAPKYEANFFDTEKVANDYFEANRPPRSLGQPPKLKVAEWLKKNSSTTDDESLANGNNDDNSIQYAISRNFCYIQKKINTII